MFDGVEDAADAAVTMAAQRRRTRTRTGFQEEIKLIKVV
jgi:hypothetical protein